MLALALAAFGAALAPPVSDGDRWVAIERTRTTIEIRDDRRRLKRTLTDLPCRPISISRAGVLLTQCDLFNFVIVDLPTGARTPYSLLARGPMDEVEVFAAGREWIGETLEGYHYDVTQYVKRATGQGGTDDVRGDYADVDSPDLATKLCAPLQRKHSSVDDNVGDVVDQWPRFDSYDGTAGTQGSRLWRCGAKHSERLPGRATVGGGWATWRSGAERIRDHHRLTFKRRGAVVHTARAVYVTAGTRVYRGRL